MYNSLHLKLKRAKSAKYGWCAQEIGIYSKYISKFFGSLIVKGQKQTAIKLFRQLQLDIKKETSISAQRTLYIAFLKVSPVLDARFRRVAGQTVPIPCGLMSESKRVSFCVKWLVKSLRDKNKTRNLSLKQLTETLIQASSNSGSAIAEKRNWQSAALANKYYLRKAGMRIYKSNVNVKRFPRAKPKITTTNKF